MSAEAPTMPSEAEMIQELLTVPGKIDPRMLAFYDYSPGNCSLLMMQCLMRKYEDCICASYNIWKKMNRTVRKGEKALWVLHPVPWTHAEENSSGDIVEKRGLSFRMKPSAFSYSQTEGGDVDFSIREWNLGAALWELEVEPIPFQMVEGNCQGYATGRAFAVSPVATHPLSVTFHELAHIVLGHTEEGLLSDTSDRTPRDVREFEAEAAAYLALSFLGIHDHDEAARGYCQSWYNGNEVSEKIARRVNSAAHKILKAGRGAYNGS